MSTFAALGEELGRAYMQVTAGHVALHVNDLESAERHYAAAVRLAEHLGDDAMYGRALSLLGLVRLTKGEVDDARAAVLDGARANRSGGQPTSIAYSLDGLAALALAAGRPAVAAYALAGAAAVRERAGNPPSPAFVSMLDALHARCRIELGDEAYQAAFAQARSWQVIEALDRVLEGVQD